MIGVEPAASDDVARSLASGRRERVEVSPTIADGQQTPTPGELTWPVIQRLVDQVVTVLDREIVEAMRLLFERCKLVVEPSGACALAAAHLRDAGRAGAAGGGGPVRRQRRGRGVRRAAGRLISFDRGVCAPLPVHAARGLRERSLLGLAARSPARRDSGNSW